MLLLLLLQVFCGWISPCTCVGVCCIDQGGGWLLTWQSFTISSSVLLLKYETRLGKEEATCKYAMKQDKTSN